MSKGEVHVVHLYPRKCIYGDLGNTRALSARLRQHGYTPVVTVTIPGRCSPSRPRARRRRTPVRRVEADLAKSGHGCAGKLAAGGTPISDDLLRDVSSSKRFRHRGRAMPDWASWT